MISVRGILITLALAFTAYLSARGLLWPGGTVPYPALVFASLGLYLPATWLCLFWQPRVAPEPSSAEPDPVGVPSRARLPIWACGLALLTAATIPTAIAIAVGPEARTASHGVWVVGGVGALMTIVMVRRRPWVAWAGTTIMGAGCMVWMGPLQALSNGLVGSIIWVVVAQMLIRALDRAARDTQRLTTLQRAASAWQASQSVAQRERRIQVQRALAVAGPVLTATVASQGVIDDDLRLEARIAEGRLRDELRGPRLLDVEVREAIDAARRRGAAVTVLDEGGLDEVPDWALVPIRRELAETVAAAQSQRLYIRTSPHDSIAVTVVGRSLEPGSDEEAVDLWREIRHPVQGAESSAATR